jgi:hypothetical protein
MQKPLLVATDEQGKEKKGYCSVQVNNLPLSLQFKNNPRKWNIIKTLRS